MPLVTLKEILREAESKNRAVGMFDVVNSESLKAIISGAEELNSPVIIALAEVHLSYAPLEMFAPLMVDAAKRAEVPVAVHLDHGFNYHTIAESIKLGFTSIMFDGSVLDFDDNLESTREIVKLAASFGVSVEAELGHVGGEEGGGEDNYEALYTDPEKAAFFTEKTGIDALAVAIGTVHGEYVKTPCLDLNRLAEINERTSVPLVLHGGSGLSDSDFIACINRGIRKINIFTDMSYAARNGMKELLNRKKNIHCHEISELMEMNMKQTVIEKIKLFANS
jgi:fructose-bisphosphate aldolase class II